MQFSKWIMGVGMLLGTLLPVSAEAQVVKNDKPANTGIYFGNGFPFGNQ